MELINYNTPQSADPLISIALPVYNGGAFIEEAIHSLLAQSGNIEIIISDDNSTDNTVEIVRALNSSSVKLLTNERNGGQFVNFNRALKACRGDYIQLFSHDDVAHKGFLATQIAVIQQNEQIGLVYASCYNTNEGGERASVSDDDGTPLVIDLKAYLEISSRHGALPPSISTVMIRRKVLEEVGLFNERFSVAGDLEFYNRVAERFLLARNRSLTLNVRAHSGSVTSNGLSPLLYMDEELLILPFYERNLGRSKYKKMLRRRSRHRGADHAKHLVRRALAGDLSGFLRGYRSLSQIHSFTVCLFFAVFHKITSVAGSRWAAVSRQRSRL